MAFIQLIDMVKEYRTGDMVIRVVDGISFVSFGEPNDQPMSVETIGW